MKKLLLILMMISISSIAQEKTLSEKDKANIETVYNDSKNAVTTVYNDVKSLSPKVESAIKELAKEFKTTTTELWNILVRQQLVWSWCFLILTISALINWYIFFRRNLSNIKYEKVKVINQKLMYNEGLNEKDIERNYHDKKIKNVEEEDLKIIPQTTIPLFKYLHLIICLTLSIFSFTYFSDMLTGFINPEYGALKTIVEVTTKLK